MNKSLIFFFSVNFVDEVLQIFGYTVVVNRGGQLILFFVVHFADNVSQVFTGSCFGEFFHNVANLETGDWPDFMPNEGN